MYKMWQYNIHFLLVFGLARLSAQELNPEQQKLLEDIIQSVTGEREEAPDLTGLFDVLAYRLQNPLNLNDANIEDFQELHLLNDFQIRSIVEYRSKNKGLKSIYELLYLPGFRSIDVDRLQSFVLCAEAKSSHKMKVTDEFRYGKSEVLVRWQRTLEEQRGYIPLPDTILQENPDKSHYLGDPTKFYTRYRFRGGEHIQSGLLMEKDAGEDFFNGSNTQGFDFYSAFISYQNAEGWVRNLIAGDFHFQAGQGLLISTGNSFGKSTDLNSMMKHFVLLKGNLSTEENRFLRGGAGTLGFKKFTITLFVSANQIDASVQDSLSNFVNNLVETGYHNTPLDIKKENSLQISTYGMRTEFNGNRLKMGVTSVYSKLEKGILPASELYKKETFSGNNLPGYSFDYKYLGRNYQLFGETALSNQKLASLNGIILFLNPTINIGALYRQYQQGYYSMYNGAFSENSTLGNENGFFLTGELQLGTYRVRMCGDVFSFPWLKYQVNAPSEGNEFLIEVANKHSWVDMYLRYHRQEKPKNRNLDTSVLAIENFISQSLRFNVNYFSESRISLQSRVELSLSEFANSNERMGYLAFQDMNLQIIREKLSFVSRVAYFNIPEYESRIYSYERDVLYAYTSQMNYGKGWRFMAMVKWSPVKQVSIWLRVSQTLFPGEKSIGSGLTEIQKAHKTDVKAQIIWIF